MPLYSYECVSCGKNFDEIKTTYKNSGKSICPRCGYTAFKIPAIFSPRVFKPRQFADGTTTPDYVTDHKTEKAWMKAEGITYDPPVRKKGELIKENSDKKFVKDGFGGTAMEHAFKKAHDMANQGFKIDKPKQKKVKRLNFDT